MRKRGLSFTSSRELRQRIDLLPDTVPWKQVVVRVSGGRTAQPLDLFYRPALDCFKFLLANPLFAEHMDFSPRHEYVDEDKSERLYNEIMTGNLAWDLQVWGFSSLSHYIIQSNLCARTVLSLGRLWGWFFSALIKLISQWAKAIRNVMPFTFPAET